MTRKSIGIIMNGVTGRMGANHHLAQAIAPIRSQGGIQTEDGVVIMPEPLLVGRDMAKLKALSERFGGLPFTSVDNLTKLLANPEYSVYFDAQITGLRYNAIKEAIAAEKHIYCEKPIAVTTLDALELYLLAKSQQLKHGVVHDKLWVPGIQTLKRLIDEEFFGRILAVRGEYGYWVFSGEHEQAQRPSWYGRSEDGGGIILDMFCHWRYLIDNLFGNVTSVSCIGANQVTRRWDEHRKPFDADAPDAAFATFTTDSGIICQFNASWCTRVRRDDLLTIQVDGTDGSAVAGLRDCWIQRGKDTPHIKWNPEAPSPHKFADDWERIACGDKPVNAFKAQWESFLRHVALDEPFPWNLLEGAKGVQLAELATISWESRAWVDLPSLK